MLRNKDSVVCLRYLACTQKKNPFMGRVKVGKYDTWYDLKKWKTHLMTRSGDLSPNFTKGRILSCLVCVCVVFPLAKLLSVARNWARRFFPQCRILACCWQVSEKQRKRSGLNATRPWSKIRLLDLSFVATATTETKTNFVTTLRAKQRRTSALDLKKSKYVSVALRGANWV